MADFKYHILGEDIIEWTCPQCKPIKKNRIRDTCWWCGHDASAELAEINGSSSETGKSE